MAEWVRTAVAEGLQALLSLRLKNTPAEDMIELTADIWVAAIGQKVSDERLDAARIAEGFRRIFPLIREWPAPIQVIELMPARPRLVELPHILTPAQRRENKSRLQAIAAIIVGGD